MKTKITFLLCTALLLGAMHLQAQNTQVVQATEIMEETAGSQEAYTQSEGTSKVAVVDEASKKQMEENLQKSKLAKTKRDNMTQSVKRRLALSKQKKADVKKNKAEIKAQIAKKNAAYVKEQEALQAAKMKQLAEYEKSKKN